MDTRFAESDGSNESSGMYNVLSHASRVGLHLIITSTERHDNTCAKTVDHDTRHEPVQAWHVTVYM